MRRSLTASLFVLLLLGLPAQGQINLPQMRRVVALPSDLARALQSQFTAQNSTHEISPAFEGLLLQALPNDFQESCAAMIENWGEIARGSAEWNARVLYRDGKHAWLAYRCSSRTPQYEDDYDERPAVLNLDSGRLKFFPLANDAQNESTLYHLDFAEAIPLQGSRGVALKAIEPPENPCCDGPESRSGETWRIFAEMPQGVTELLSIVTARDDSSHSDDPEIDTETTYRAQVTLDRGPQGNVREVLSTFTEEVKEITYEGEKAVPRITSRRSGTLRYRWNPKSFKYEEIK